ncbi:MAG: PQQ-binding-like beta-propeller repeat protein [Candidatus Aenigmarchaeota archaeon]|nr:PQQ-binding-like beta-propeller repeat protein [Candidatus Aenigmarchaeota archaeon]
MSKYVDFNLAGPFSADLKPQFEHSMIDAVIEGLKMDVKEARHPQVWGVQQGGTVSTTPVVDVERIYVGTADGQMYCLSLDGKQIWKFQAGDVITSTPTIDGGKVYFGCFDGFLYCLDFQGREVWKFQAGDKIAAQPSVDENSIYVGSKDGYLYCISKNGELVWKFDAKEPIGSVVTLDKDTVYVPCYSNILYSLTKKGEVVWSYNCKNVPSAPTLYKDNLYFSCFNSYLYALTKKGEFLWKYNLGTPVSQGRGPAVDDDIIYVGDFDGKISAINTKGELVWKFQTDDMIFSKGLVEGDIVYFTSLDSNIYAIDKKKGSLIWKAQIGGPIAMGVGVSQNSIIAGTWNSFLYSVSKKGEIQWKFQVSSKPPSLVSIQTKVEFNRKIMDAEILNTPLGEVYRLSRERNSGNITHAYGSFGGTYIDREGKEYTGRKREGNTRYGNG